MFWPESFWADAETVPLKVSDNLSLTVDSDDNAALNLMDLRAAAFFASDTQVGIEAAAHHWFSSHFTGNTGIHPGTSRLVTVSASIWWYH